MNFVHCFAPPLPLSPFSRTNMEVFSYLSSILNTPPAPPLLASFLSSSKSWCCETGLTYHCPLDNPRITTRIIHSQIIYEADYIQGPNFLKSGP